MIGGAPGAVNGAAEGGGAGVAHSGGGEGHIPQIIAAAVAGIVIITAGGGIQIAIGVRNV